MINKAILVGRLGKDPECRSTQSGKTVCNFTLATDTGFGDSRTTDWHRIVCFDRQAEFCRNYMRKGSLVYVEGRISYRQYEKDGVKQYVTEIIANSVQSLQSRAESQGAAGNFDVNVYDSPAYGGGNSYNAPSYGASGSAPASAPAPADNFGGDGGIPNDDIPF
jgi:single-strand DNA-binding protein